MQIPSDVRDALYIRWDGWLYLGGDAYSSPAVYVKEAGYWNIYYICRDYLGSITHIANADGSLKQELSYDAWGRLRNPDTQVAYFPSPQGEGAGGEVELFLGRGYTGHEHLTWLGGGFGLINMNARLYDPALGRFLSPDPYIQSPDFTQNFNRYSYCLNNPFKYTDPTGELTWNDVIAGVSLVGGIAINIFAPPMAWLGTSLIVAGFAHFAYSIDLVQENEGMTWNDASNIAGFQFSTSININKPDKKEKNGGKENTPLNNIGSSIQHNVSENTKSCMDAYNNQYYFPTEIFRYSDMKEFATKWSIDTNQETMVYYTSKGWYIEKTEGWFFGNGFTEPAYKGGYMSNNISGAYPFSLYARDQVRPSNNPNSWSTLYWAAHTHPHNNSPSNADMRFSNSMRRPFYTWGWSRNINDEYIIRGMYYEKVWTYLKYGL